jgi:hypothetical protein
MDGDGPDDIGLKRSEPVDPWLLETPDDELVPVLEQLRRNLENMQGNYAQVEGLDEAMGNVLFRNASAAQYAGL